MAPREYVLALCPKQAQRLLPATSKQPHPDREEFQMNAGNIINFNKN
jgi:hypothetical protein